VAPFLQGDVLQDTATVSHRFPVNPSGHLHW